MTENSAAQVAKEAAAVGVGSGAAALATQGLVAAAIPTIQSTMATASALGAIMPWYVSPMMSFTTIGVTSFALPVAVFGATAYGGYNYVKSNV